MDAGHRSRPGRLNQLMRKRPGQFTVNFRGVALCALDYRALISSAGLSGRHIALIGPYARENVVRYPGLRFSIRARPSVVILSLLLLASG